MLSVIAPVTPPNRRTARCRAVASDCAFSGVFIRRTVRQKLVADDVKSSGPLAKPLTRKKYVVFGCTADEDVFGGGRARRFAQSPDRWHR